MSAYEKLNTYYNYIKNKLGFWWKLCLFSLMKKPFYIPALIKLTNNFALLVFFLFFI